MHTPPEGRKHKHNKPFIPMQQKPQRQNVNVKPQSSTVPGPIDGMNVARRIIYQSAISREQWYIDMLIAINSARSLGINTFEISVDGTPVRQPAPQNNGGWLTLSYAEAWQTSVRGPECTVTVFAVVVE